MKYIAELSSSHIIPAHRLVMEGKVIKEYPEIELNEVAFNGIAQLRAFLGKNNYEAVRVFKRGVDGKKQFISL